jgi:hypothetical protein
VAVARAKRRRHRRRCSPSSRGTSTRCRRRRRGTRGCSKFLSDRRGEAPSVPLSARPAHRRSPLASCNDKRASPSVHRRLCCSWWYSLLCV